MFNNKPTFGGTINTTNDNKNSPFREEVGCIWNRVSKNGNHEFLSIKLPKAKLKEILEKAGDTTDSINFVAFKNKSQQGDLKRPSFRIFEEENK